METVPMIYLSFASDDGTMSAESTRLYETLKVDYIVLVGPGMESTQKDWAEKIQMVDSMILLIDKNASESQWIKQELIWAREANVSIVPILMGDVNDATLDSLRVARNDCIEIGAGRIPMYTIARKLGAGSSSRHKLKVSRTSNLPNYSIFNHDEDKTRPIVNEIMGNPKEDAQYRCDVFVVMPFAGEFAPIYRDCIRPIGDKYKLSVKRGDDFFSSNSIMTEVWSAIFYSYVVIADCTGRNANVFYELGMAHSLNKSTILLTQDTSDIPFDIRHMRHIAYQNNNVGIEQLGSELESALLRMLFR
jgi:hypothetical protein